MITKQILKAKRKLTLFIILNLISTCIVYSQKLMPYFGISYTTTSLDLESGQFQNNKQDFLYGMVAGIGVEVPLSKKMFIHSGLQYIQKGSFVSLYYNNDIRLAESNRLRINYIEMPLLFGYTFKSFKNNRVYLRTGFNFGYFANGKSKISYFYDPKNGTPPVNSNVEFPVKVETLYETKNNETYYIQRKRDIGLHIGGGIAINEKFSIDVGYTFGLTENRNIGQNVSNRVLQLSIAAPIQVVDYETEKFFVAETDGSNLKKSRRKIGEIYVGFSAGKSITLFSGSEVDFQLESNGQKKPYLEKNEFYTSAFHFKYEVFNYLFAKSGIHYIRKGSKIVNNSFKYPLDATYDYLAMPILLGIQPFNYSNTKFLNLSVEVGFTGNFEINSNDENLTKGLLPGYPVTKRDFILSKQIGYNAEVKIYKNLALYFNYTEFKDLRPLFRRVDDVNFTYTISTSGELMSAGILVNL